MEKNSTIQSVNDFAETLWNLKAISKVTGVVEIEADKKETINELLNLFKWVSKFSGVTEGDFILDRKDLNNCKSKIRFCDFGLGEYELTVNLLFKLADGLIDYNKLSESNYSMKFSFTDVGQMQISEIDGMKLVHKKGEPVETPQLIKGKKVVYPYNFDNVISIMFDKGSHWTKTGINDMADLFLNEVYSCTFDEPRDKIVETLKKSKKTLCKLFKVDSLIDIYHLNDAEFDEKEDLTLKEIFEEATA